MSKKIFIAVVIIAAVFASLFYLPQQRNNKNTNEDTNKIANIIGQPIISQQKITITETERNMIININSVRIIIGSSYSLDSEINKAITTSNNYSHRVYINNHIAL